MDRPICKACSYPDTRRIPRNGVIEVILSFFYFHPYRCQLCCTRFRSLQPGRRFDESQIDRRQLDRIPVEFEGLISTATGQIPILVTDMNAEGCQCISRQPLNVGDDFDVSLYLVPGETPIHVLCSVVRDRENDSYGLSFKMIGAMEWHIIRRYLAIQQERHAK